MCDVTFSPKSWENCYVTVHDYRRRFTDPYNFEFGSVTQTRPRAAKTACVTSLVRVGHSKDGILKQWESELDSSSDILQCLNVVSAIYTKTIEYFVFVCI